MKKTMNFKELGERAYQTARSKGWHDVSYSHAHFVMMIITELCESIEADREGRHADRWFFDYNTEGTKESQGEHWINNFNACIKDTVEDELADAVIRALDFVTHFQYDLNIELYTEEEKKVIFVNLEQTNVYTEYIAALLLLLVEEEDLVKFIKSIFALCEYLDIDLLWHIEQKMKYNELRPHKHGEKNY